MVTRRTYSKNFSNVVATMDREKLNTRFNTVLNSVSNMVANTSVYTTWIKVQIGGDSEPLIFNTSSQSEEQNLLVSLQVEKVGARYNKYFYFTIHL